MKYCILLFLSLIVHSAFAQGIMPSVGSLSIDIIGTMKFNTTTYTKYHPKYGQKDGYSDGTDSIKNPSAGMLNTNGKVIGDGVGFYGIYYWITSYSKNTFRNTVEVEIDTINSIIKRLYYFNESRYVRVQNYGDSELKSFSVELHDIPYTRSGDTIRYFVNRNLLLANKSGFRYNAVSALDDIALSTTGTLSELSPDAFLRGMFVKLNTNSSFTTPNQYSISINPDIQLKQYHADSIAVHYRNDYPDTVAIQKIEVLGSFSSGETMIYADGKSLATEQRILPFEKDYKIYLSYSTSEGPNELNKAMTFVIAKKISGKIYLDTILIVAGLKDANYDPYISIDSTVPNQQLTFDCKIGDVARKTIRIDYTKEIYGLSFPPILDGDGFTLSNVAHGSNTKNVEFLFTSDTSGTFVNYYYFDYMIQDFKGKTQYRHYSNPITLLAKVDAQQSVKTYANDNDVQVFPNPALGNVTVRFKSKLDTKYTIQVFDALGREVRRAYDGFLDAGEHVFSANLPTGAYYVRLQAGDKALTRKVTVVK